MDLQVMNKRIDSASMVSGALGKAVAGYWVEVGKPSSAEDDLRSWSRKPIKKKQAVSDAIFSLLIETANGENEFELKEAERLPFPEYSRLVVEWHGVEIVIVPFASNELVTELINGSTLQQKKGSLVLVVSSQYLSKSLCQKVEKGRLSGRNLILISPSDIDELASFSWSLREMLMFKLFKIFLEGGNDADAQYKEFELIRFRAELASIKSNKVTLPLQSALRLHKEKLRNLVPHPTLVALRKDLESANDVLLVGSSASGKTTLALSAAEKLSKGAAVYYIDVGGLNVNQAYRVGLAIFSKCAEDKGPIFLILDDCQTDSGLSQQLLVFFGLLKESIFGQKLRLLAISWKGNLEFLAVPNVSFKKIEIEPSSISTKMIDKYGMNLKKGDKEKIRVKSGSDLLVLRIWLEISSKHKRMVPIDELAPALWRERVVKLSRNKTVLKRGLFVAYALGMFEIDVSREFLKRTSGLAEEDIQELVRGKLLSMKGTGLVPPHRSFARLLVEYINDDAEIWRWLRNKANIRSLEELMTSYLEELSPHAIWSTLELVNRNGGIKSTRKSQAGIRMLIESWKKIDQLKKKINDQIAEDPSWRNSISSSAFACVGLATLGRKEEAAKSLEFIRQNYGVVNSKLEVRLNNLSTESDFAQILEKMAVEERDGTLPSGFGLELSENINIDLFHKNWASGIVLTAEAAMEELPRKELESLAIAVENRIEADGYFYPSRVPWCTARILMGLGLAGRNIHNSHVVKKAADWLLTKRTEGGGREDVFWKPGTDGWNTHEETTAMCIIALRSVDVPVENQVLMDATNWLMTQPRIHQLSHELELAIAAEAHLMMNRPWDAIEKEISNLATWANTAALWRNATLNAKVTYDQTCKVAQVGAFIITIMLTRLTEELPSMLAAIDSPVSTKSNKRRSTKPARAFEFDVAITYASENRAYVKRVAKILKIEGVKVFYDEFSTIDLWAENLVERFDIIFREKAKYCAMFISKAYAEKAWTTLERRSAQARALEQRSAYILPIRFDDTELPGMLPTTGYLDANKQKAREIAEAIIEKIS